jgi:hypothetical protein
MLCVAAVWAMTARAGRRAASPATIATLVSRHRGTVATHFVCSLVIVVVGTLPYFISTQKRRSILPDQARFPAWAPAHEIPADLSPINLANAADVR